jgi:hypothetical protein
MKENKFFAFRRNSCGGRGGVGVGVVAVVAAVLELASVDILSCWCPLRLIQTHRTGLGL